MKDQEIERLMRQISQDAALDDSAIEEIADSPALWWKVQREIRVAAPVRAPWPPNIFRRWLMLAAPVAAALVIFFGIYLNGLRTSQSVEAPAFATNNAAQSEPVSALASPETGRREVHTDPVNVAQKTTALARKPLRPTARAHRMVITEMMTARAQPRASSEVKSDFIALAYARDPDSGQIVRVKVPSSMMVELGVVPTVDKPSQLVDAEVLVGDDGLTRGIRFIRQ